MLFYVLLALLRIINYNNSLTLFDGAEAVLQYHYYTDDADMIVISLRRRACADSVAAALQRS